MAEQKDDWEILEPKEYTGKADEGFSYAGLVMTVFRKAIENGSKEMREGYWNTKFDKLGNAHKIWIPDSRQEFIETVESALMILDRDMDKEALEDTDIQEIKQNIDIIKKDLEADFKKYLLLEKQAWQDRLIKEKLIKSEFYPRDDMLSKGLSYFSEYTEEKVKASREILKNLGRLVKKLNDFKEGYYEA